MGEALLVVPVAGRASIIHALQNQMRTRGYCAISEFDTSGGYDGPESLHISHDRAAVPGYECMHHTTHGQRADTACNAYILAVAVLSLYVQSLYVLCSPVSVISYGYIINPVHCTAHAKCSL